PAPRQLTHERDVPAFPDAGIAIEAGVDQPSAQDLVLRTALLSRCLGDSQDTKKFWSGQRRSGCRSHQKRRHCVHVAGIDQLKCLRAGFAVLAVTMPVSQQQIEESRQPLRQVLDGDLGERLQLFLYGLSGEGEKPGGLGAEQRLLITKELSKAVGESVR